MNWNRKTMGWIGACLLFIVLTACTPKVNHFYKDPLLSSSLMEQGGIVVAPVQAYAGYPISDEPLLDPGFILDRLSQYRSQFALKPVKKEDPALASILKRLKQTSEPKEQAQGGDPKSNSLPGRYLLIPYLRSTDTHRSSSSKTEENQTSYQKTSTRTVSVAIEVIDLKSFKQVWNGRESGTSSATNSYTIKDKKGNAVEQVAGYIADAVFVDQSYPKYPRVAAVMESPITRLIRNLPMTEIQKEEKLKGLDGDSSIVSVKLASTRLLGEANQQVGLELSSLVRRRWVLGLAGHMRIQDHRIHFQGKKGHLSFGYISGFVGWEHRLFSNLTGAVLLPYGSKLFRLPSPIPIL